MNSVGQKRKFCSECDFVTESSRLLSRHKAITHSANPLSCPVCPFVTIYQTNLLRHRREVHGILGSARERKSCKFCDFEAETVDEIIHHHKTSHQDLLRTATARFSREKTSATSDLITSFPPFPTQLSTPSTNVSKMLEPNCELDEGGDDEFDLNFDWRDSFMDTPVNMLATPSEVVASSQAWNPFQSQYNQQQQAAAVTSAAQKSPRSSQSQSQPRKRQRRPKVPVDPNSTETTGDLAPTRIRRQYTCEQCNFRTVNPREFLYHRRDAHQAKVKIVECPYCVYACQYFQKLQRHILLVHKLETSMTPPSAMAGEGASSPSSSSRGASTSVTSGALKMRINKSSQGSSPPEFSVSVPQSPAEDGTPPIKKQKVQLKKPIVKLQPPSLDNSVDEDAFESSLVVDEGQYSDECADEEEDQIEERDPAQAAANGSKRQPYNCKTCKYSTSVQHLFKRHVKFHNAPKMKCYLCNYESLYSWQVDRHMKTHRSGVQEAVEEEEDDEVVREYDELSNEEGEEEEEVKHSQSAQMMVNGSLKNGSTANLEVKEASVKLLHCAYCDFTHKESKSMVSHMSIHTGKKPYKCRLCDFSSNWKEVVARHAKSRHNGSNLDVDQQFKYTVSKFICRVSDESGQLNLQEVTFPEDITSMESDVSSANGDLHDGEGNHRFVAPTSTPSRKPKASSSNKNVPKILEPNCELDEEDEDFDLDWRDSFVDTPVNMLATSSSTVMKAGQAWNPLQNQKQQKSPASSKSSSQSSSQPRKRQRKPPIPVDPNSPFGDLAPTRIRRQYNCEQCKYRTINPRDFLYHRRDEHQAKVKIVECPYCVYACQYFQKLQRHVLLVHKLETSMTPPSASQRSNKGKGKMNQGSSASSVPQSPANSTSNSSFMRRPPHSEHSVDEDAFEASLVVDEGEDDIGDFDEEFDDGEMEEHPEAEENALDTNGSKRQLFQCETCGYGTSAQYLFKRHVKFHTAPKIKCDLCNYESPYSWQVERHKKTHRSSEGVFNCTQCSFSCESPVSLTAHMNKSHQDDPLEQDDCYEGEGEEGDFDEEAAVNDEGMIPEEEGDMHNCNQVSSPVSRVKASEKNGSVKESTSKLLHCAYCEYVHKESKSMVSHMSVHTGKKPYKCRSCDFSSNWKEVVARHAKARHNGSNLDVDQLFKYTVNKFICRVSDDTGELNLKEVTFPEDISTLSMDEDANLTSQPASLDGDSEVESSLTNQTMGGNVNNSKLGLSGFRGDFKCNLCPFRAEKAFHIDFHSKRHQQTEGADFKCPHCPYWVNAKKSLMRHIYLHDVETGVAGPPEEIDFDEEMESEVGFAAMSTPERANYDRQVAQFQQQQQGQGKNTQMGAPLNKRASSKNKCDSCPFVAGTKTQLLYHKQFHRPNRAAYKCPHCTYSVSHQHLLNQHLKVHFRTDGAQSSSNAVQSLSARTDTTKMSDSSSSSIPFVLVTTAAGIKVKMYQCRYCSTKNKRKILVMAHEQLHSQGHNHVYRCCMCTYSTRLKNNYADHIETHNDNSDQSKAEKLRETLLSGPSKQPQNNGNGAHRRMFSYVCPNCPAAFKSPGDLKIHSVFHGDNSYPHACPYCTYRAKNKPQLCKHLYVHTQGYVSKRANSYPDRKNLNQKSKTTGQAIEAFRAQSEKRSSLPAPPRLYIPQETSNNKFRSPSIPVPDYESIEFDIDFSQIDPRNVKPSIVKKVQYYVEQLCLIESFETQSFLEKLRNKAKHRFIYKCPLCPAAYVKNNTLKFHSSLHFYHGIQNCTKCSYSVDFDDNLQNHQLLHINSSLASASATYTYNHRCTRCPAAFSKPSRLEKHLTLHGSGARWKCDHCDYAVPYAATLVKHRHVHDNDNITFEGHSSTVSSKVASQSDVPSQSQSRQASQKTASQSAPSKDDDKKLFHCDRCPYSHTRRDAVQSHQKRHGQPVSAHGKMCPHCDYVCLQPSYLREHIRLHFDASQKSKDEVDLYKNLEIEEADIFGKVAEKEPMEEEEDVGLDSFLESTMNEDIECEVDLGLNDDNDDEDGNEEDIVEKEMELRENQQIQLEGGQNGHSKVDEVDENNEEGAPGESMNEEVECEVDLGENNDEDSGEDISRSIDSNLISEDEPSVVEEEIQEEEVMEEVIQEDDDEDGNIVTDQIHIQQIECEDGLEL